jgi:hypothetical protein
MGLTVSIATPCHGGAEPQFVVSLVDTVVRLHDLGHRASWGYLSSSQVHTARNAMARVQVRNNADVVVQIDADQTWDADDLVNAIECVASGRADVVGFPILGRQQVMGDAVEGWRQPSPWCSPKWLVDGAGHPTLPLRAFYYEGARYFEVAGVGGILVIARSCIDSVSLDDSTGLDEHGNRILFDFNSINGVRFPEDFYFCQRARDLGHSVYVHADAVVGHIGKTVHAGDFAAQSVDARRVEWVDPVAADKRRSEEER